MYISKFGFQLVLTASVLVMLLACGCAEVRSFSAPNSSSDSTPSSTWAHFYSSKHKLYMSTKRIRRSPKVTMAAHAAYRSEESLLRLESFSSQDLAIRIFSEDAGKYICFHRNGRLLLIKRPENRPNAICRFQERFLDYDASTVHYVADEKPRGSGGRRVLSFCGDRRRPNLRHRHDRHYRSPACYAVRKLIAGSFASSASPAQSVASKTTHRRRHGRRERRPGQRRSGAGQPRDD